MLQNKFILSLKEAHFSIQLRSYLGMTKVFFIFKFQQKLIGFKYLLK